MALGYTSKSFSDSLDSRSYQNCEKNNKWMKCTISSVLPPYPKSKTKILVRF